MVNQPLSFYTDENSLRFYLLSVGEGLMIVIIFPNNQVMLFDCNVTNDNEEEILSILDEIIPEEYDSESNSYSKPIDCFVNSHRDEDHYRGLKKVNERFPIKSIWDSGQTGETTTSTDYQYYMRLRRTLKSIDESNLYVPIPSNYPIESFDGVEIYCLAAEEDFVKDHLSEHSTFKAEAKVQHTNSMVLMICYQEIKLLLTGDSDWKSWKEKIIPNFGDDVQCNILVASHHGSRSFFTDESNENIDEEENPDSTYIESIKIINPNMTLISCGEYATRHHPNRQAMKLYKEYTSEEQVYTTHDKGHLFGFIDENGYFTVVPDRFKNSRTASSSMGFKIQCKFLKNGKYVAVKNNSEVQTGVDLIFSLDTYGGIIEPFNDLIVYWEVSNGGIEEDFEHQEIYHKDKDEKDGVLNFSRQLAYKGTHLLRCKLRNKRKGQVTQIFRVIGI